MDLRPIDRQLYAEFIQFHFKANKKEIAEEAVHYIYDRFEGITWYIQFVANVLYTMTDDGISNVESLKVVSSQQ